MKRVIASVLLVAMLAGCASQRGTNTLTGAGIGAAGGAGIGLLTGAPVAGALIGGAAGAATGALCCGGDN